MQAHIHNGNKRSNGVSEPNYKGLHRYGCPKQTVILHTPENRFQDRFQSGSGRDRNTSLALEFVKQHSTGLQIRIDEKWETQYVEGMAHTHNMYILLMEL